MNSGHLFSRRAFIGSAIASLVACQRSPSSPRRSVELPPTPAPGLPSVLIEHVPHVRQKPDFCGEAVAASWLRAKGLPVDQDDVFDVSGLDPARGMGVTTRELATALEHLGVKPGRVWYSVSADRAAPELARLFAELHADLERGVPSIVCMHYDERPDTTEHFRLVLGYDAKSDEVVYHEPAEDAGSYRRMSRARFLSLWPLHYAADRWTVIRFALEPGALHAPARPLGFRPADYAQHVMKLREKLPAGFSVVVEPPFVVLGDGGPEAVGRSAESTVRWTVQKLEQDFFRHPPQKILDVWLFRDKASYERHVPELTGEAPSTPYGFYTRRDGALIMNIATGGGTLVHEIVHPYMEANVPGCPAWLNEGLGSLFEQSAERDGHIVGLTNWRLGGLQRAVRAKRAPNLTSLLHTTDAGFYGDDSGVHYAAARYLLYYLQEHALLLSYWNAYLRDRSEDPSGFETLGTVLGRPDMAAFQRRWERWVLGLRFAG
jgi:Peptidase_C39 like family